MVSVPGACARPWRRGALAATAVLALSCGTGDPAAAQEPKPAERAAANPRLLAPLMSITGMRVAQRVDPTGTPRLEGPLPFKTFRFPSGVAARWPDLYVIDSGARTIYRLDMTLQVMTVFQEALAFPETRIRLGADQSVYLLDPSRVSITRFSRSGAPMYSVQAPNELERPGEFVVDDARGRILVVDALTQRLFEFRSLGRGFIGLSSVGTAAGQLHNMNGLAAAGDALFVLDASCRCIAELDREGSVLRSFGHDEVRLPVAMAADRHRRLYVVDGADQSLKVFAGGRLAAKYSAQSLGLVRFSGLAADEGRLYVADGPGAKVSVFRIAAPGASED